MTFTEFIVITVAAVAVAVLGVGRLGRVIIYDAFPPAAQIRIWWDDLTSNKDGEPNSWNLLLHCPWCLLPWLMAGCMGWYALGWFVHIAFLWAWWIFWGWLAISYVASMVYIRDERP